MDGQKYNTSGSSDSILTGLASITFSIGASTYAVAAPTTLAAYLVIWDGTTLRAVILPKA